MAGWRLPAAMAGRDGGSEHRGTADYMIMAFLSGRLIN